MSDQTIASTVIQRRIPNASFKFQQKAKSNFGPGSKANNLCLPPTTYLNQALPKSSGNYESFDFLLPILRQTNSGTKSWPVDENRSGRLHRQSHCERSILNIAIDLAVVTPSYLQVIYYCILSHASIVLRFFEYSSLL